MRLIRSTPVSRTIANAAVQTLTFTSSEIESQGVVAYHISLAGAGAGDNVIGDITRIRLKANTRTIYDHAGGTTLRTLIEMWSGGILAPAAARPNLTIPLWLPGTPRRREEKYLCGFPRGAEAQLEIVLANTVTAGQCNVCWTTVEGVDQLFFPQVIGNAMNIAASQVRAPYVFGTDGALYAIVLNDTGLISYELVVNDRPIERNFGAGLIANGGSLHAETDALEYQTTLTDPVATVLDLREAARRKGSSYIQLETAAGWAGVTNELTTVELLPQ